MTLLSALGATALLSLLVALYLKSKRERDELANLKQEELVREIKDVKPELQRLQTESTRLTADFKKTKELLNAKIASHRSNVVIVPAPTKPSPGEGSNGEGAAR